MNEKTCDDFTTLGPIVGAIINHTVRILFESNCKTLFFSVSAGYKTAEYSRPNQLITIIDLLNGDERHTITINQKHTCSFDPVVNSVSIISCDGDGFYNYNNGIEREAWKTANNVLTTHAIHIGDQVYVDNAYDIGIELMKKKKKKNVKQIFDEEIRAIYRKSWYENQGKRRFLATHSNIMMIDDHEIYDNFTSPNFDKGRPHMLTFLDVAATIAGEYQIGLSQDVEIKCFADLWKIPKTIHVLQNKYMKFVILNSRLMKTKTQMFDKPELGKHLHLDCEQEKLIVVDQVSPFIVAHKLTVFTKLFTRLGFDIVDHVTANKSWIEDYEWLFRKMCGSNATKLVFVTGDLHVGQNHNLYSDEKNRHIRCLTSSPISSNVGLNSKYNFNCIVDVLSHKFKGFRYSQNLICHHNFVVVSRRENKLHIVS